MAIGAWPRQGAGREVLCPDVRCRKTRLISRVVVLLASFVLAIVLTLGLASAVLAAPVQFFYVPLPEDQILSMLTGVENGGPADAPAEPITSYITITTIAEGTIIYYDQWENGFDVDVANTLDTYHVTNNPDGTQIWGDGNPANGAPPGFASDSISAGAVIQLENDVVTTTRQAVIDFDGGDKIAASKTIAVTRTSWAGVTTTLFAGCVEVFDTNNWGTDYRAPVGTDLADNVDYQMFEYTALSIMAGELGATVYVDANADGDYTDAGDLNGTVLAEGESTYVTGVYAGAQVTSDNPVQVDIFSGDIGSYYESRDSALLPTDMWADCYYTPVSTPAGSTGDARTTVWLHNAAGSAISVTYERRNTSGALTSSTVSVPAGGVAKQILENATDGTGSRFYTTNGSKFYAYSTTDSASTTYTNNQAWDWSFTMIPETMLTTQALVGLGLGRDPTSPVNMTENGNPIWVTTAGNGSSAATVYVDYDADPATGIYTDPNGNGYDASYSLRELDQARVYVPSFAVDATSTGDSGNSMQQTLNVSHTTGTGANRLMVVEVAIGNDANTQRDVQSVTYGGTALTLVGRVMAPAGGGGTPNSRPQVEIWALANPASGTANVTVTLAGGTRTLAAAVRTFTGADVSDGLTSALGSFASASAATGTAQSVAVATTTGQYVYDVVAAGNYGTDDPSVFTAGSGQGETWSEIAYSGNPGFWLWRNTVYRLRTAGSLERATGASTTMSWTSTTSYPWASAAVVINPLAGKNDQTGLLLYTLDTGVKLAVAWGQDPLTATTGAPGLDVGTSVPPTPEFTAGKDGALYDADGDPGNGYTGDNDGDGYLSPGDVMVYPITVYNVSRLPVPDVVVWDEVPVHTSYVPGSTVLYEDDDGDGVYETSTAVPDDDPLDPDYYTDLNGTVYPLDGLGVDTGSLPVAGSVMVTFRVLIDGYDDLPEGTAAVLNGGQASALGWDDPVDDKAFLRGRIGDYVWYDTDMDGIQDAGETGIEGIRVQLLDGAGNPLYDGNSDLLILETDADGYYEFTGLPADDYIVYFQAPDGAGFSPADAGGEAVDSDADPATGYTGVITLNGGQRISSVDAGLYQITPTVVVVTSFDVAAVEGGVAVWWETGSEANTAGFYVERLDAQTEEWTRVQAQLVPALLESAAGGAYTILDRDAGPGEAVTYRLVEIEMDGTEHYYGPYDVVAARSLAAGEVLGQVFVTTGVARVPKLGSGDGGSAPEVVQEYVAVEGGPGDRLRMEVGASGLYRVQAADVAVGLGLTEEQVVQLIRSKGLRLTSQGRSVAYLQAPDCSALYFYGRLLDSIYDTTNVYWLEQGRGATMPAAKNANPRSQVLTTFIERAHFEENVFPITEQFHEPGADFWLWSYLAAGFEPLSTMTFSVDVPDALAGVRLEVEFRGLTVTGIANEHHAVVRLNGVALGETRWTGMKAHKASFAIPAETLRAGTNEVEVAALLDSGIPYSLFAVDCADVVYERAAEATADRITLTAPATGLVEVTGLSGTDAWVFDLSNPSAPQLVGIADSGGEPGAAWVRFNGVRGKQYLVTTVAGSLLPGSVSAHTATGLRSADMGAEYVVITTPALAEAAGRVAAYREGQGLSALVVTTDAIYNEFNAGLAGPDGVRRFLEYALTKWQVAPRYVLLAGEGSYDYKDYMHKGDCLVPPLMVDTEYGLAPSDVALADVRGADGVPEAAIGRLPVLEPADLDAALSEIVAYESAGGAGGASTVLLTADNSDPGGNFSSDGDAIAGVLPPSLTVLKAYLDLSPAAEVRSALLGAFADGAVLVEYVGHGGEDMLAGESLLTTADVASLPGGARLPLLTAFTCKVGQYALPGYDTLGEALVKRQGAGAIGVWAPSTMEDSVDSARLGVIFSERMFGSSTEVVLGDVIQATARQAAGESLPAALLLTHNLLGDPALRVGW